MSEFKRLKSIQSEIDSINNSIAVMGERKSSLVEFILSDDFLEDYKEFNLKLHKWVNSLIILLKDAENPIVGEGAKLPFQSPMIAYNPANPMSPMPVGQGGFGEGSVSKLESHDFSVAQAIVVIIINVCVLAATITLVAPIIIPILAGAGSLVLVFGKQIAEIIKQFMGKEEEQESVEDLRHYISKSIAVMRDKYTQRRFRIMHQRVTRAQARNADPNEDDALFDLKIQSEETLAQDFLSKIDWIDTECNDAAFRRKQFLFALLESKGAPMVNHP